MTEFRTTIDIFNVNPMLKIKWLEMKIRIDPIITCAHAS
jgi:hypothetical protein